MHERGTGLFETRVSAYSFILTVIVIWIHAVEPATAAGTAAGASSGLRAVFEHILGTSLGQLAVPGFFCMSGYLFFRSLGGRDSSARSAVLRRKYSAMPFDSRTCGKYESAAMANDVSSGGSSTGDSCDGHMLLSFFAGKLKTRVRTILLPYLIWNGIYYLIYAVTGRKSFGAGELLDAFINYSCNPVFWYLHELIIITVLTPLIYIFIRKRAAAIAAVAAVFAAAVWYDRLPFHIVNEDALCYYMAGAALALHCGELEENNGIIRRAAAACFLLLVVCMDLSAAETPVYIMAGTIGSRLSGLLLIFFAVSICIKKPREKHEYEKYNFFIYAVHYLEIRLITLILGALCTAVYGCTLYETEWLSVSSYVLMPFICIALSLAAGRLMRRYTPMLYAVLTGGRG